MKFDRVAAIAQTASAIAVVLTLIYLAIQATQTNQALLATSRQATMAADVTMIAAAINSPESWGNLGCPFSVLNFAEQAQVSNLLAGLLRVREFAFFQYQNGIMDESAFRSYVANLPRFLSQGDARQFWESVSAELNPEFVAYINQLALEAAGTDPSANVSDTSACDRLIEQGVQATD